MEQPKVDSSAEREALESVMERNVEAYRTFQREFDRLIASGEPEEGVTRIQLLEQLMERLGSDLTESSLKYVGSMVEALDEREIIASKGPSSSGAVSS